MEGEFPEDLKCPVCFEVPEKEIYQCKNGHTICEECSQDIALCPQCRVEMGGDGKIRSRALENLLDMMKFDCSYKTDGCTEKVSRKDITNHFDSCTFGGQKVPFCSHLGYDCNFQANSTQPQTLFGHLKDAHQIVANEGNAIKIKMKRITKADSNMKILWTPIIVTLNNKHSILLAYTKDNAVSFTLISIDDKQDDNYRIEYSIKSNSDKCPNLEWVTKIVPYTLSESIIKNPPFSIPFVLLEKNFIENDHLNIRAFISTQNDISKLERTNSYHHTMRTELNIPQISRFKKPSAPTIPISTETPSQQLNISPLSNDAATVNIPPSQQIPHSLIFPSALTLPLTANMPHSSRKHRHHRKSRDHGTSKLLNPMATLSCSGESHQPINCHKVWSNINCDSCKVRPLTGARYKCLQCKNYDLCGSCVSLNVHPHHFVLLTSEAQRDTIMHKIGDRYATRKAYIERLKIPDTEADSAISLESTFQPQLTRCSKCTNNADYICLQCCITQNNKFCSECFVRDTIALHNANHFYAVTRTQRARKFVLSILLLEGLA